MTARAVGIDLTGVQHRPTGFAVINHASVETKILFTDESIIAACREVEPSVIAIDAPLSKPVTGRFRACDRALIKRGLRVLPPLFGGMKKLTNRGIRLSKILRNSGFDVIEIHPRTSGLLLFGTAERRRWIAALRKAGFDVPAGVSAHEIDALVAAVTGWLHIFNGTTAVGARAKIVIPGPNALEIISRLKKGSPAQRPSNRKCAAW